MNQFAQALAIRFAIMAAVCALLSSAIVLAQVPKAAPAAAPPQPVVVKKADAKVEAKPAKAAARKVFDLNANINAMAQQFIQQGRPMLRAELLFLRHVSSLNADRLRPIVRESEQALEAVAKKMAEEQQNGRIRVRRVNGQVATPDPATQLHEGLSAVFKKNLTESEWACYQSEVEKRSADRREAGVSFLVDAINRDLVLSSRQQDQLREALAAHWEDRWGMSLEYIFFGNHYYPMSIETHVTPLLNDHQKKVWQSVQKIGDFWGFGNMMMQMVNDGDPLMAELGLDLRNQVGPNGAPVVRPAGAAMKKAIGVPLEKAGFKKEAVPKK